MSADGRSQILAIGGFQPRSRAHSLPGLLRYALDLTGRPNPRVCLVPTAHENDLSPVLMAYQELSAIGARPSHLSLFPQPNVAEPADLLLDQDLIFVGGGSVANMLAVWRVHGLLEPLTRAWKAGTVLAGVSAGAICWFESGTTDSFGSELRPFKEGVGILPGSYCPHYLLEPTRRPTFQRLVASGDLPPGVACDDGAAAHYVGTELTEIVAETPGATGYLVTPDGAGGFLEAPLPARLLVS